MLDLKNKTLWQQSCGDTDRNYSKVCLDWDVILNGPGYAGVVPANNSDYRHDGVSKRKITNLNKFAYDMEDGDIVVLRIGTNKVFGVGIVCGDYEWLDIFGDIDGWDIQHTRRVKWLKKFREPVKFPTYTLKQGFTTQKLDSEEIENWIKELRITQDDIERPLEELPADNKVKEVGPLEITEFLFDLGVASNSINKLLDEIDELERIAKWYNRGETPSEHETVAYLVVPLLRALGWTPQKMSIEWNNVDLALFDSLPREDKNLEIVVEAKKKGNSCLTAKSQAERYAKKRENCNRLIVTDGLRYGVYVKKDDKFGFHSYLNLTNLKSKYPIYQCPGAMESLWAMTPEWQET